jgi:hypothetical protein
MRFFALEHGFSISDAGIKHLVKDKSEIDDKPSKKGKKDIVGVSGFQDKSIKKTLSALLQR